MSQKTKTITFGASFDVDDKNGSVDVPLFIEFSPSTVTVKEVSWFNISATLADMPPITVVKSSLTPDIYAHFPRSASGTVVPNHRFKLNGGPVNGIFSFQMLSVASPTQYTLLGEPTNIALTMTLEFSE